MNVNYPKSAANVLHKTQQSLVHKATALSSSGRREWMKESGQLGRIRQVAEANGFVQVISDC